MTPVTKTCKITGREFDVTEIEQRFCEQMGVPLPDICPGERIRRLMNERNARSLYYRKCDFSGKTILSQHHPDTPFPVYETSEWWSDKWDGLDFGQDFNFERPFFEQFLELKNKVPHMSVFVISGTLENSDYTNCTGYIKNCYLISESDYDEDCYFSNRIYHSRDIVDCSNGNNNELCYECMDCTDSNRLMYSEECAQCRDSYFLYSCKDCSDCIGCINQNHKQYMIFNVQYTREEYEQYKKTFKLDTHSGAQDLKAKCESFFSNYPHRAVQGEHNENCTGDHLYHSKNSFNCFDASNLEDCFNCVRVAGGVKSAHNYSSWGFKAELIYMCSACGDNAYNLRFCSTCTTNVSNCTYCYLLTSCSDCFGCIGLKNKKYCIFNKQYTKEEYEKLMPRIIEHMKKTEEWGQYFPKEMSSFAYNESIVMENFPLTKEEALALGYRWRDEDEANAYQGPETTVPDSLDEVSDEICKQILKCEISGKLYKIIPQELKFYRKLGVPLPRRCPTQRHADRYARRNTYKLYSRTCSKGREPIVTTYPPDKSVTIYCQEDFLKEIY